MELSAEIASKWLQVTPGKASQRSSGRKQCRTSASYNNNNSGGVDIADRVVAALPFCIPLFDGLRYGGLPRPGCLLIAVLLKLAPARSLVACVRAVSDLEVLYKHACVLVL